MQSDVNKPTEFLTVPQQYAFNPISIGTFHDAPRLSVPAEYPKMLLMGNENKELFRITSDGVMQVNVAADDEHTKQFIACVNNMLAHARSANTLTKIEIVKEV